MTRNPDKALIFRITHRDNLPWILDHGHASNGGLSDPNYRNIGNPDLIGKRSHRSVRIGPGGTLSGYVLFYFTPFSIMMYNIHTGYGVRRVPNEGIVILISSLIKISEVGISFVFTDQHAYPAMANYFTSPAELSRMHWDLLNRRDFKHDPDDPAKKELFHAEALIWRHVPPDALLGICSCNTQLGTWLKAEVAQRT